MSKTHKPFHQCGNCGQDFECLGEPCVKLCDFCYQWYGDRREEFEEDNK